MSFAKLYAAVQNQQGRISTGWLRKQVIALSHITHIREQWSSVMDASAIRGVYIEGPIGAPVPRKENEVLIILARSMCDGQPTGPHWRRFVLTKELMHAFDEEVEKANSPETFDRQIEKFGDPSKAVSAQFRAEVKAYWRALAVLCPEALRREYARQIADKEISIDVVAAALHLPIVYARDLFRDDFEEIVAGLL